MGKYTKRRHENSFCSNYFVKSEHDVIKYNINKSLSKNGCTKEKDL